jgi:predicted RNase H-like HicB family nuclease
MYYPATLTPYEDGSGRYGVTFVDLPGCVSVGENLDDALRMAAEALSLHVGSMIDDNDPLPRPSTLEHAAELDARFCEEEDIPRQPGTLHQYVHFAPMVRADEAAPVRLSISLKKPIVDNIDAMAEEMGLTRSGLIAVATRDYINRMRG